METTMLPFIGHLYNAYTNKFLFNSFSNFIVSDISINDKELHIVMGTDGVNLGNDNIATHIVVEVQFNITLEQYKEQEPTFGRISWHLLPNQFDTLTLDCKADCTEGNVQILCYTILPIESYKKALLGNHTNYKEVSKSRVKEVLTSLNKLLHEIQNFNSSVKGNVSFCITQDDMKKLGTLAEHISGKKDSIGKEITHLIKQFKCNNWIDCLKKIYQQIISNERKIKDHFENIKFECLEKVKFVNMIISRGIKYMGKTSTIEAELKQKSNQDTLFYVMFFSRDFNSKNPTQFSETLEYFLLLSEKVNVRPPVQFIAVDLDFPAVHSSRPDHITISLYKGSSLLVNDLLLDEKQIKKNKCFVLCSDLKVQKKPSKRSIFRTPCPGAFILACTDVIKEWRCHECFNLIEYGFNDLLYCACGCSHIKNFSFKCDDYKHGPYFKPKKIDVLLPYLTSLKPMKQVNILLVGHSGVGKSTLINGLPNYINYETLEDAKNGKLFMPIPLRFTMTDDNDKSHEIVYGSDPNEVTAIGASSTQDCITYCTVYNDIILHIIDTPGIYDVRGLQQDRDNVERIIDHLKHENDLHGILILLKPNESRLDTRFQFCLKEILTHLHKSATKNIVFCFTYAKTVFFRAGECYPILEQFLQQNNIPVNIQDPKVMYYVDNESFRYLCTLNYPNISFSEETVKMISNSWQKTNTHIRRLLDNVIAFEPHNVKDTQNLNYAKLLILTVTGPIGEITYTIDRNITSIEDQLREVEECKRQEKDFSEQKIKYTILEATSIAYPKTVCNSTTCATPHLNPYTNLTEVEYTKICHDRCYLTGIVPKTFPNPKLLNCWAMNSTENCTVCNCRWEHHLHVIYDYKPRSVDILSPDAKNNIDRLKTRKEKAQKVIEELENHIAQSKEEKKKIIDVSVKFGQFLKQHAITPYNDAIGSYLDYLIDQEETRPHKTEQDKKALEKLKKTRRQYDEEVRILEAAMRTDTSVRQYSPGDIFKWEKELYDLSINGKQLKQIIEVAMQSQAKSAHDQIVNLNQIKSPTKTPAKKRSNFKIITKVSRSEIDNLF